MLDIWEIKWNSCCDNLLLLTLEDRNIFRCYVILAKVTCKETCCKQGTCKGWRYNFNHQLSSSRKLFPPIPGRSMKRVSRVHCFGWILWLMSYLLASVSGSVLSDLHVMHMLVLSISLYFYDCWFISLFSQSFSIGFFYLFLHRYK